MLLSYDFTPTLAVLYLYMLVYNCSLIVFFWTLQHYVSSSSKTLFSFSDFKLNTHFITVVSTVLFSMAGVPPFIGFFTKINLLILLVNANFFFFFIFFFSLLFFALYFYVQNIRFLLTSSSGNLTYSHELNLRASSLFYLVSTVFTIVVMFGFLFLEDLYLFTTWLFV